MKSVFSVVALSLTFLSLIACSNMADNSLLTDQASSGSTSTIDKTANSSSLSLSCDSSSITMPTDTSGSPQVQVTGDCYTSTYPSNYIKAYIVNTVTQATTALTVMSFQGGGNGQCVHGRYGIIINASGLASGSNTVKIVLTAVDANNNTVSNDANASRVITIIK